MELFWKERVEEKRSAVENVETLSKIYTGVACAEVLDNLIDAAYAASGEMLIPFIEQYLNKKGNELVENQYLLIQGYINPLKNILYRYTKKAGLKRICNNNLKSCGIMPRNIYQSFAMEALLAPPEEIPLVILQGAMGSGKVLLSLATALEKVINVQGMDAIRIVRGSLPSVDVQNSLMGLNLERNLSWAGSIRDDLRVVLEASGIPKKEINKTIKDMLEEDTLSIESMKEIQGRSLPHSTVIVVEAQETTQDQIIGILSNIAANTKIVLIGNLKQVENCGDIHPCTNGLAVISERMKGSSLCAQVVFGKSNSEKSPLAKEIAQRNLLIRHIRDT